MLQILFPLFILQKIFKMVPKSLKKVQIFSSLLSYCLLLFHDYLFPRLIDQSLYYLILF